MNNEDILLLIVVQLDNQTLAKLLYPDLWPSLKRLLSDQTFWYQRCQHLVSPRIPSLLPSEVDWRRVYRTLYHTLLNKQWYHLDYLPSIFVLEGLDIEPDLDCPMWLWSNIESSEVLQYMLEKKYIEPEMECISECLERAAHIGCSEIISPLLALGDKRIYDVEFCEESYSFEALCNALASGHRDIAIILLYHQDELTEWHTDRLLGEALGEGNEQCIILVLEQLDLEDKDVVSNVLSIAERMRDEGKSRSIVLRYLTNSDTCSTAVPAIVNKKEE